MPDDEFSVPRYVGRQLGISWQKQREKLPRNELVKAQTTDTILVTGTGDKRTTILRSKGVYPWWMAMNPRKVNPEIRAGLL
jgi:hypothetical protein